MAPIPLPGVYRSDSEALEPEPPLHSRRAVLLSDFRFHDLKHTFATLMFSNGASLNVVQETLGHSQASMTLDVYGHVLPNHQKEAIRRLGDLLS
jgi:integrase